jgi:hypothetical protein
MKRVPVEKKFLVGPLALLLLFLVLPMLVFTALPVSSQAAGTLIAMTIAVALYSGGRLVVPGKVMWAIAALILVHFVISMLLVRVDVERFGASLLALVVMIVGAIAVSPALFTRVSQATVQRLFYAFLLVAIFAILGIQPDLVNATSKPTFPFSEPSMFALSLGPVLLFVAVTARRIRRMLYIGAVVAVGLLLQNMTMIVGAMIVLVVCLPIRLLLMSIMLIVIGLVSIDSSNFSYYTDRLNFSSGSDNLTALVYQQGWQMMGEAWTASYGWGTGFQQLGVNGTSVDAGKTIVALIGQNSNLLDGSFVLCKLVSEFGIFGLLAVLAYLSFALQSFRRLREYALSGRPGEDGVLLADAVVLMFLIEIFMRSAGYLTGTAAMLVAALAYLHRRHAPRGRIWFGRRNSKATGSIKNRPEGQIGPDTRQASDVPM